MPRAHVGVVVFVINLNVIVAFFSLSAAIYISSSLSVVILPLQPTEAHAACVQMNSNTCHFNYCLLFTFYSRICLVLLITGAAA